MALSYCWNEAEAKLHSLSTTLGTREAKMKGKNLPLWHLYARLADPRGH